MISLLPVSAALATPVIAALQSHSRPEHFFWAGVLIALVPVAIFSVLTGTLVLYYRREVRSSKRESVSGPDA